ncbi:medium chain dehydrogenase/reductase family protein [Polyangium sp. 6x1]|uniref:synaptic vesicle VAT-1 family membrane protein n=1 Tax=Polyangium sp. 6x1 TaxID=3042689 RepID=UPI00248269DB|nr:medium chain dehydrogenase/reductase family protein [Polyangium sp. 6x1]MDI1447513.1 medium chain dehydrogenase/reductase family protein [Polyangium sp. 6x1]
MRKVVIHGPGSYDRLKLEEHPDPSPAPGEILVDVEAAGVNYADCIVRMGLYESAKKYVGWPITPGFEVAGKVAALGAGVGTRLGATLGQAELRPQTPGPAPGTPVVAVTRFGGYASRVAIPAHQVFPLPKGFSVAEAAGFPSVFLTAYYALFELANVRQGMNVLVHSAAGGVGSALVELGKIAGCRVVGVVGASHKVAVARKLGADAVIDKSVEPLWPVAERLAPEGYDVVLDANGVETLGESYRHLASAGKLVVYGFHTMMPRKGGRPNWIKLARDWLRTPRYNPLDLTNDNKSVLAFNLSYLFHRKDLLAEYMGKLIGWIEEGRITAPPVTPFPVERVADAHRAIEGGSTVGKLVLTF